MSSIFDHLPPYHIARNAQGHPLELTRAPGEKTVLAFDARIRRLVELHVLDRHPHDAAARRSMLERAQMAAEIRGPGFQRVFEAQEHGGAVYYASALNDGELVEEYIARRGALPAATVFCLVLQLLEDLVQMRSYHRLAAQVRLNPLLITTLEDTFLQLRVLDLGLSAKERREEGGASRRMVVDVCRLIFLLLTGQEYAGGNPDRFSATTCLPSSLRATLRMALLEPDSAMSCIERLRDEVREAFAALVSNLQARCTRKHLVVADQQYPRSHFQSLLLEDIPVAELLAGRFTVEGGEGTRRYPFSIPARHAKTGQELTVHLLPPSRIVDKDAYEAVPLQMWRFDAQKHPNILRSTSVWEGTDWTFLTEERESGFPLSRLIAERITLNPAEVTVLLRQVKAGLDQALECGVDRVELHPSNLMLNVGKAGPMQAREFEKLMQKRVDAWPVFRLKLRPHMTMRCLYEPLMLDCPANEGNDSHLVDKDFRNRSFVALAAYLLTGERQIGRRLEFPETVSPALAHHVSAAMEKCKTCLKAPTYADFLARFEEHATGPAEVQAYVPPSPNVSALRGTRVAVEGMESAGSVSDFDDDEDSAVNTRPTLAVGSAARLTRSPLSQPAFGSRPLSPSREGGKREWLALVACVVLALFFGFWLLSLFGTDNVSQDGSSPAAANAANNAASSQEGAADTERPKRSVMEIRRAIEPTPAEVRELRLKEAAAVTAEKEDDVKIAAGDRRE
jgi:hypothetical protein